MPAQFGHHIIQERRFKVLTLEVVPYKERQLGLLKIYNDSVANAQLK